MIYFNSDYTQGAHPSILEALCETNLIPTPGYGEDPYCRKAARLIRTAAVGREGEAPCRPQPNGPEGRPLTWYDPEKAGIHFLVGGTQANLTVISAALRPHQGVLSADSGHIHVHETGAVEATGHKVLTVPETPENRRAGKISAQAAERLCRAQKEDEAFEHFVQPKMIYLSHPTENGTLYTREELLAFRQLCDDYGLYLFLDGARLSYGLAAAGSDVTLPFLARICDAFYIGGTKTGALFGEAVVVNHPAIRQDFRYIMKQKGGMLAKGRLLGLQFLGLFQEDRYLKIAKQANDLAAQIREACIDSGFPLLCHTTTNQQFPILPNALLDSLKEHYSYSSWEKIDDTHTAIRLCTSWATTQEEVDALISDLKKLRHRTNCAIGHP